jgi:hypothetical protein
VQALLSFYSLDIIKKYYSLFVQYQSQYFENEDIELLNYACSIEQLQATFYVKATDTTFSWMSPLEESLFKVIRNQEVSHCQFFKDILDDNAISELEIFLQ